MKITLNLNILLTFFVATFIYSQTDSNSLSKDHRSSIEISVVGDIMCHSTQFKYSQIEKDTFDFKPVFSPISSIIRNADFALGNLETVVANKGDKYKGYPVFNSPPHFLSALEYSGFDMLFTANNHCLDRGEKGLKRTLTKIAEYGMGYCGSYVDKADRDSIRYLNKNGIKIAVLAFTYGTNGFSLPNGKEYLINRISDSLITKDIKIAEQEDPDAVMVYLHFGNEYDTIPSPYQIDVVKSVVKAGADIIVASHPHVVQKIEFFKTNSPRLDSGIVAYSLGNFVSNQRWRYSDCGAILNFNIEKDTTLNKCKLGDVGILPFWVYKGEINGDDEYRILPSRIAVDELKLDYLSTNDNILMRQSYFDVIRIMKGSNSKLNLINITKINKNLFKNIYFKF